MIEVEINVGEAIVENGYEVIFERNDDTPKSLEGSNQEQVFEVETSDLDYGNYNVGLRASGGLLSELYGVLTGSGSEYLDSEKLIVRHEQEWQGYCLEQDFVAGSIDGKVSFLDESVIPDCFEGDSASHCGATAESLCQDLLGYSYDSAEQICVPQDQIDSDGENV